MTLKNTMMITGLLCSTLAYANPDPAVIKMYLEVDQQQAKQAQFLFNQGDFTNSCRHSLELPPRFRILLECIGW